MLLGFLLVVGVSVAMMLRGAGMVDLGRPADYPLGSVVYRSTDSLLVTRQPGAIVVPSQAVQSGQKGQYVFVVKADQTVEARPVVPGASDGRDVVITSGLKPGERVVTDGQLRLVPGARVDVKAAAPGATPGAPASPAPGKAGG